MKLWSTPVLISAILLVLTFPHFSDSLSDGAPASVCESMTPKHNTDPQTSPSPYTITLSKTDITVGQTMQVTVSTNDESVPFKGFFAMAVSKTSDYATAALAAGEMSQFDQNGPEIKQVNCKTGIGLTHADPELKKSVTFNWTPPNEDGEYVILVTIVKDYRTFWAKQVSTVIRVRKDGGFHGVEKSNEKMGVTAAVTENMEITYDGCGATKGCFGHPSKCVQKKNCQMLTTWRVEGSAFRFQLAGRIPDNSAQGHVSIGLSSDTFMGQDSVVGCVLQNGAATPKSYYNLIGVKDNSGYKNETVGLIERSGTVVDGWVFCNFSRTAYFDQPELQRVFDLSKENFYIMLASSGKMGTSKVTNYEKLGYHYSDVSCTAEAYHLTSFVIAGEKSNILIQLHGAIMIIAWVMTSSLGMFVARYYKQTHTDFNPFNKAFWFVLHVGSMFLTVGITFLGVILIFIEISGFSYHVGSRQGQAHPYLGLVLTGICGFQLIIGLLRPHPGTPKRPLYNWVHWAAGNIGHILGIACLILAMELPKARLSQHKTAWGFTLGAFVLFHILMHLTLSMQTVWADKKLNNGHKLRGISVGPMKPSKPEEAPGTSIRTFLLFLYIVGIFVCGITLIVILFQAK